MGGGTYKFKSITNRGVADRIVCLPNGTTWFIEVKTEAGKISSLQKVFAEDMQTLKQNYACLWSIEEIDHWRAEQESDGAELVLVDDPVWYGDRFFCSKCGAQCRPDDRFCSYCGTKITTK